MDQLMESAKYVSELLIPTVLLIVLIFLIVLLYKIIKLVTSIDETVKNANKSVDMVNISMDKLQAPLDSIVKISDTVDKVHEKGITVVKNTKEYLVNNTDVIKDKIRNGVDKATTFVKKPKNKENDGHIPSPEDIIGGKY